MKIERSGEGGPKIKMTQIIQVQLRNVRRNPRDPHEKLPPMLERLKEMDALELERQESEYWARIWEKSLDPRK